MKTLLTLSLVLILCGCANTNHPSVRSNPATMSSDTLCYRYATAKRDPAYGAEVKARGLDCAAILESDPLYNQNRY